MTRWLVAKIFADDSALSWKAQISFSGRTHKKMLVPKHQSTLCDCDEWLKISWHYILKMMLTLRCFYFIFSESLFWGWENTRFWFNNNKTGKFYLLSGQKENKNYNKHWYWYYLFIAWNLFSSATFSCTFWWCFLLPLFS